MVRPSFCPAHGKPRGERHEKWKDGRDPTLAQALTRWCGVWLLLAWDAAMRDRHRQCSRPAQSASCASTSPELGGSDRLNEASGPRPSRRHERGAMKSIQQSSSASVDRPFSDAIADRMPSANRRARRSRHHEENRDRTKIGLRLRFHVERRQRGLEPSDRLFAVVNEELGVSVVSGEASPRDRLPKVLRVAAIIIRVERIVAVTVGFSPTRVWHRLGGVGRFRLPGRVVVDRRVIDRRRRSRRS